MYSVSFKKENCLTYGILPVRRPNIPAPEEEIEEVEIPGRDGVLTISKKVYKPISIEVEFNFMRKPDDWGTAFRKAKKWLKGSGNLEFSDDAHYLYKTYYCKITDTERTSQKIGTFTAEFVCDPYMYPKEGQREKTIEEVLYNPYETSHAIYIIKGEGMCTISVNGKEVKANVGQNLTINTDLMIAYREDGTLQNTEIDGEYEDLYLQEGENQISTTEGFQISIVPNWRCL